MGFRTPMSVELGVRWIMPLEEDLVLVSLGACDEVVSVKTHGAKESNDTEHIIKQRLQLSDEKV